VDERNATYSSANGILFNKTKTAFVRYPQGKPDKTYTIPAGVTSVGNRAFSECVTLTGITIPAGVTSIGEGAFSRCGGLTGITIPGSVASIGGMAFWDNQLTAVTIGANITLEADSFGSGFEEAYNRAGKAAGTYTRPDAGSKSWTKK
jgi:hypothetical protein